MEVVAEDARLIADEQLLGKVAREAHFDRSRRVVELASEEVAVGHLDDLLALHALDHADQGLHLRIIDFAEALGTASIGHVTAGS